MAICNAIFIYEISMEAQIVQVDRQAAGGLIQFAPGPVHFFIHSRQVVSAQL